MPPKAALSQRLSPCRTCCNTSGDRTAPRQVMFKIGFRFKPKPHLLQHLRRPHGVHGRQCGQAQVLLLQRGAAAKHLRPLARARLAQRLCLRLPSLRPEQLLSGTKWDLQPAAIMRLLMQTPPACIRACRGCNCLSGPARDWENGPAVAHALADATNEHLQIAKQPPAQK